MVSIRRTLGLLLLVLVPLARGASAETMLRFPDGEGQVAVEGRLGERYVLVPVTIEGPGGEATGLFVVDTGATNTVVSARLAQRLGLPELRRLEVGTAGDDVAAGLHATVAVRVGGVAYPRLPVVVADLDVLRVPAIEGLLGLDFLREAAFRLDLDNARLTLLPPEIAAEPPADATRGRWVGRQLHVPVDAPGFGRGWVMLDTGSNGGLVLGDGFDEEADGRLAAMPWTPEIHGSLAGLEPERSVVLPRLEALGRSHDGVAALLPNQRTDRDTANLGLEVLGERVLCFDPWGSSGPSLWLEDVDREVDLADSGSDAFGNTAVMRLLRADRFDEALALVEAGVDITARGTRGKTLMHAAAGAGATEVVAALLDAGAAASPKMALDTTPLWAAASTGESGAVALLLDRGAKTDEADEHGDTPLHAAIDGRHTETVALLLARGADPDAHSGLSGRPLHNAARLNDPGLAEALLDAGADPDGFGGKPTPLHVAVPGGAEEVFSLLLDRGADAGIGMADGRSTLALAASEGRVGLVRRLLEDEPAEPELQAAVAAAARAGKIEATAVLLHALPESTPGDGVTPFFPDTAEPLVLPLKRLGARLAVEGSLDGGPPLTLLLATEQRATLLLPAAAARLGSSPITTVAGGRQRDQVPVYAASSLDLGGTRVPGVTVAGFDDPSVLDAASIDGVLGADVLHRLDLTIDFAAATLTLHPPGAEPAIGEGAAVVRTIDGVPCVEGVTPGVGRGWFRIGTGTGLGVALGRGFHEEAGDPLAGLPTRGAGRARWVPGPEFDTQEVPLPRFEAFGTAWDAVEAQVGRPVNRALRLGDAGVLGAACFAGRRLRMDGPGRRVLLSAPLAEAPPEPEGTDLGGRGRVARLIDADRPEEALAALAAGADARVVDADGWTLLHHAADRGAVGVAAALLDAGVPANAADASGVTPLLVAALGGREGVLRLLPDRGVPVDAGTAKESTALRTAVDRREHGCVEILLAAGADPAATPEDGFGPLSAAAIHADLPMMERLLQAEAPIDGGGGGGGGVPPLATAAFSGEAEAVAFLLGHGADPDARGEAGQTPLFPAVASGSEAAVRLLLDAGADAGAADDDGYTPLDAAVRGGDPRIIRLLLPPSPPSPSQ